MMLAANIDDWVCADQDSRVLGGWPVCALQIGSDEPIPV
jgi:hypothetical protein